MEYRNGMNYGTGINILNGQIPGKGVIPGKITEPTDTGGMKARYYFTIIRSFEELYNTLGISIAAGGHYGLFSAEGKFEFANETKFNSQSTFVLARAVVQKPFTQCEDAQLEEGAAELIRRGKMDVFRQRFGDGFVRGMQTGGEFFAIIEITNEFTEKQEKLALSIKGEYESLVAGIKVETDVKKSIQEMKSQCKTNVVHYQTGGVGTQGIGPTISPEQVVDRLMKFADIVREKPVPYSIQVAGYITLDLPEGPNPLDYENQKQVLEQSARLRLKLINALNDIQFIQLNRDYFENPPEITVLNKWSEHISDQLYKLTTQASACANNPSPDSCKFFALKFPDDYSIPKRKEGMPTSENVSEWDSTVNDINIKLVLRRTGNQVTGIYYGYNDGIIEDGILTGNVLQGRWKESESISQGRFRFVFNDNRNSFSGTWGYGDRETEAGSTKWIGTLTSGQL